MQDILISAKNISLELGQLSILEDISIDIKRGQITTLIGTNGSGKTSLLKIFLGLTKPSYGQIERKPNLSIGYMPQRLMLNELLPMRVYDFLSLAHLGNKQKINQWLSRLEIVDLEKQSLHNLSGGQWQRVLLIRALLNNPDVLFLDEPMQGIDLTGQKALYNLIPTLRDELNCAVMMVSHDLHLVMAQTDEVICLDKRICCSGAPSKIQQHPAYLSLFGQEYAAYIHHHNHTRSTPPQEVNND